MRPPAALAALAGLLVAPGPSWPSPRLEVDAVQVTAAPPDVPGRRLTVVPVTPSHVTVPGASLPAPGTWTIDVIAVRQGEPVTFTFEAQIR